MTDSALTVITPLALAPTPDVAGLVAAFFGGKSPRTIAAYKQDLEGFRQFLGAATMDEAAAMLLGNGPGRANATVLAYRNYLHDEGKAPSTINRRLAAIRSLVTTAQLVGLVAYEVKVPGLRRQVYKDVQGPGDDGFLRMLAGVEESIDAKDIRDHAILRLLHDLALRRGEVVSLDLVHVRGIFVDILGKGKSQREPLKMPDVTRAAIARWVAVRGEQPGPLFTNLSRNPAVGGTRLTGTSIYRIVRGIGRRAGIETWPHGLRHLAITQALEAARGNVRAVKDFSRHASVETVMLYDDKRTSKQGEIAALVAAFATPQKVRNRSPRRRQ